MRRARQWPVPGGPAMHVQQYGVQSACDNGFRRGGRPGATRGARHCASCIAVGPVERSDYKDRSHMDAVIKKLPPSAAPSSSLRADVYAAPEPVVPRPSREEAEAAVRTLIAYAGDNPG